MKDILSAFGSEVFRPLVTLFVPGAVAISTWLVALLQKYPSIRGTAAVDHFDTVALTMIAVLFAGMIVEDWGSRAEARVLDPYREWRSKGIFIGEWKKYLLIAYVAEPVAKRYLSALLIRLKFELDAAIALVIASIGAFFVDVPTPWPIWIRFGSLGLALYLFFFEARATHKLMGEVRHSLLTGTVNLLGGQSSAMAAAGR